MSEEKDEAPGTWAVTYLATVSKTIRVEAADMDEAITRAEEKWAEDGEPWLCGNYCAREMDLGEWYPDTSEYGVVWEPDE